VIASGLTLLLGRAGRCTGANRQSPDVVVVPRLTSAASSKMAFSRPRPLTASCLQWAAAFPFDRRLLSLLARLTRLLLAYAPAQCLHEIHNITGDRLGLRRNRHASALLVDQLSESFLATDRSTTTLAILDEVMGMRRRCVLVGLIHISSHSFAPLERGST
jgi:hypothetical protein